jgi:hypothetical protein
MSKISINMVPDNSAVCVSGVVDFSRITKRLEGAELEADNARKMQYCMMGETKPHTRLCISQARIAHSNAANPTIGEQFIAEKFYSSKKNPDKSSLYTGLNKGITLDAVICDEPIRYAGAGGANSSLLSAHGFTVTAARPETVAVPAVPAFPAAVHAQYALPPVLPVNAPMPAV